MRSLRVSACALLCFLLVACEEVEQIVDGFRDLTPHEAYLASLERAGLAETALGRDWMRAAAAALEAASPVELPFRDEGYLAPETPEAIGYRFSLVRGQVLTIRTDIEPVDSLRLFVDFFRVPQDPDDPLRPVQETDTLSAGVWQYEPNRAGDYLLRLQPELLRGGRYRVTLTLDPALAFPVEGTGVGAIGSGFGAARDGGARSHHGVDIFAPRGTPALAAAAGVVSRVQVTGLGGKVVWIQDERRGARLYYAHLDSQTVARGQRVEVGDTVGFVGNTGNAITTPPHLHFGVYIRGAVDPDPFLRPPRRQLPTMAADPDLIGGWARLRSPAELRASPAEDGGGETLPALSPFRVLSGSGAWLRVRLPDDREGWIPARVAEGTDRPLGEWSLERPSPMRAAPTSGAPVVAHVGPRTVLPVLGAFHGYSYVETPDGLRGWVGGEG
jgi:peptidoglycan LD-endopeptidase LytH